MPIFRLINGKVWLAVEAQLFIIIAMQQGVLQPANHNNQTLNQPVPAQLNVNDVKRKIGILKEALIGEREANRKLEGQLYERAERLKKIQVETKKREEKNEALLLEIRSLKDALIAERNYFFDGEKFFECGIIGDAQACIEKLERIEKTLPNVCVAFKPLGIDLDENSEILRFFNDHVRPHFHHATKDTL